VRQEQSDLLILQVFGMLIFVFCLRSSAFGQDDPCVPAYRIFTCDEYTCMNMPLDRSKTKDDVERCWAEVKSCHEAERRKWDANEAECRRSKDIKGGNSNSPNNAANSGARKDEADERARKEREKEERINNAIDAEMAKTAKDQERDLLNKAIDATRDIESGAEGADWDREKERFYKWRLEHPYERNHIPKSNDKEGDKDKRCTWTEFEFTIFAYGSPEGTMGLKTGVTAFIADGAGRTDEKGGYMVIKNGNKREAYFGLQGRVDDVIAPESKRKVFLGEYINSKTREVSHGLLLLVCIRGNH
jgi:hypothetical protein